MREAAAQAVQSRWKAYSDYKNSGIDWLGTIPEHWMVEPLKHNSYVKGRIGWQNLRSDEFTTEGPYLITGMHFADGSIDWDSCYHITQERYDLAPEIQIRLDDLLLTKDGSIGKVAHIDSLPGPASLNSHLLVIRPLKKKYIPRFLYYLLLSPIFEEYTLITRTGTTFFGITQESVMSFPVLLPTLSEQNQIAAFLDRETARIDELIERKKRLIELLQERRAALISHAVTKGLDPDVPMKDSGVEWIGEIPAHWEPKRVKYLAAILRGKFSHRPRNDPSLYEGMYPFIQTGDVSNAGKYITEYHQTLNEAGFAVSKLFPANTLVMTIAANIGDIAILTFDACFPDSIVGFIPSKSVILTYLYYSLVGMKHVWESVSTQNTQQNLNIERIGDNLTVISPIEEQTSIVSYLDDYVNRIEHLVQRISTGIERLKEYRTALISAAVTGKIDVREE